MNKSNELKIDLSQFRGSSVIYKMGLFGTLYTEGIKYLADVGKCHWLITDVSVMGKTLMKESHFITADFKRIADTKQDGPEAIITYSDGNENILQKQAYGYTDFPMDTLRLFFVNNTLMLPTEY